MPDTDGSKPAPDPRPDTVRDRIAHVVAAYAQRPDARVEDIVDLTVKLTERLDRGEGAGPSGTGTVRPDLPAAAGPVAHASTGAPAMAPTPAVAIEASVGEDRITCLCCGARFQTLKRHLKAAHGLTEAEYRAMFGLGDDYPMVAPSYSRRRSQVAVEHSFGKHDRENGPATRAEA